MPCSAAACACASRSPVIASATTRSCSPLRPAARAGEHAVDLGAGVGAAGLALAARVAGLKVTLVEIDPALCALAAGNARLNQMDDRVKRSPSTPRIRKRSRRPALRSAAPIAC